MRAERRNIHLKDARLPMSDQFPNDDRQPAPALLKRIFSRENLIALAVCLMLIALIIVTADSAPQWIYQGF